MPRWIATVGTDGAVRAAGAMDGAGDGYVRRTFATGASSLLTGLCAASCSGWGSPGCARDDPEVLLATLPLAAIATFEAVGGLAAAVQRLDATEAPARGSSR